MAATPDGARVIDHEVGQAAMAEAKKEALKLLLCPILRHLLAVMPIRMKTLYCRSHQIPLKKSLADFLG